MTQAICYVEGPGDKLALERLLNTLIETKAAQGVSIRLYETPSGDRKKSVLLKGPAKALNILGHRPDAQVALIPDLYPKNRGFPHETFEELRDGIFKEARRLALGKGLSPEVLNRLKVFCFKHDFEVLVLASEEALAKRLGIETLRRTWTVPVENQDLDQPPKKVVEALFRAQGKRYRETVDAPAILEATDPALLAERCPQCFAPFLDWLESLR